MKILIASDSYIFQTNGAASMVMELVSGLRHRGYETKVLAPSNRNRSFRIDDDYFIRSFRALYYPDVRFSMAFNDPLIKELKEWKPDLIHVHTEGSMARMARNIAAATGAPMVMSAHTNYEHMLFGDARHTLPVRTLMRVFGKWTYRDVSTVITPSEKGRSLYQLEPAASRLQVIPNGVHLDRIQEEVSRNARRELFRKYDLEDNGCVLVMVTRLSREKNTQEILQCFRGLLEELPQAQLLIVGDGPDRKRLEALCSSLKIGEQVRFAGRVPREDVHYHYALGDIYVSASTAEMHSMSYLEAMACGLPLVCRSDSSLHGVLEHGKNGVSFGSEQEFVEGILMILTDPFLHERMQTESLLRADEFAHHRHVEDTIKLYEEVKRRD